MAKDDDNEPASPILRNAGKQNVDRWGAFLVQESEKYRQQALSYRPSRQETPKKEHKGPPGGFDDTPIPEAPPGYTVKITIHRADNLPFSDLSTLSSDPYILAVLKTSLVPRHKSDPDLRIRIPTIHRTTNPIWNAEWVVANVPASGFFLKCRLFDEDPADHDDRLGNVHVHVQSINDEWKGFREQKYKIKKRVGSKRAYLFRACAAMISRNVEMSGDVIISVENLGRTQDDNGGHIYTVGPLAWSKHYSPLIGRLTGTKDQKESEDGKSNVQRYNFLAVQMQFQGPVPSELYHRYVEFKPFVAGMFTDHSIRGRILNRALHHQHARVYNFDRSTEYGSFASPSPTMTKRFLDFVHYDQGGRLFTYVLTLDGQFRFTETGKEFGIDLLSKHTMHSDVSIYIAFSGEFFVRRLKHPHRNRDRNSADPSKEVLPPADDEVNTDENNDNTNNIFTNNNNNNSDRPQTSDSTTTANTTAKDPKYYELIIDNDSGTYRPNAKLLPTLKEYFAHNLPGLRVVTLDCQADEEKMTKLKDEQREVKKSSGRMITYLQNTSMSSISSSEEEVLEERAKGVEHHESKYKRQLHRYVGRGEDEFHGGEGDHYHSERERMVNGEASGRGFEGEKIPTALNQERGNAERRAGEKKDDTRDKGGENGDENEKTELNTEPSR